MTDQPPPLPLASAGRERQLHPVTPLLRALKVGGIGVLALITIGWDAVPRSAGGALGLAGLFLLVMATAAGWSWVAWRRFRFWFDADGDLRVRSGVLQVTERRVQLSRLQSVDVAQPLLARLVGLAEVRPEVAGATGSTTTLSYLALRPAHELRAELLARAAGLRVEPDAEAPTAPERVLVSVPAGVLLASLVLQPAVLVLGVALPLLAIGLVVLGQFEVALPLLLLVATPYFIAGGQFTTWFGFTVATSPDGLRLRFGLTSHRSQTVPPGRVQAVRIHRPWLWRRWGWVRVVVNVAGATSGEAASERPSMLLPVAPEPVARAVLAQVLPGVDALAVPLDPVPRRARWRAPLQARRLAVGADGNVWVSRHGWLVPTWDVVPHARTQSVRVRQGPWQRRLGLASVHVDSTPGPVQIVAAHREQGEARRLAEEQLARARAATSGPPRDRWLAP